MRPHFVLALALTVPCLPAVARAQTQAELAAARNLFAEALRDEDAKRYDLALEKYRRVQAVRDTAPIRYRIGSCHEGLGQLAQALTAYRAAVDAGQKEKGQEEVARAARARIDVIWKRVPQLTLIVQGRSVDDAEIRIDDRTVPGSALKEPVYVDPGEHVITANAPGAKPFRTVVFLPERGRVALTVPLEGAPPQSSGTSSTPDEHPTTSSNGSQTASAQPVADGGGGSNQRLYAGIAMGVGAAVMVTGGVFLGLRSSEIGTMNKLCPEGVCKNTEDEQQFNAARDRALTYGPLGGALIAAGAVTAGVGAVFFFTAKDDPPKTAVLPWAQPGGAGVLWSGRF